MRYLLSAIVAVVSLTAAAAVPNLESYYIRHDFSKGSNNCITNVNEAGAKDVIGDKFAATEGPNGEGNAARVTSAPWDELNYAALNSGWTFAACLRVGDKTDNGVIVSIGRLYGSSVKRRALVICSSSDSSKLYVRVVRRYSNYYTDVNITLSDLGDVTAAFHTIVVTCSGNNLVVYWDGEKKATATMTNGYTFGASDKLPGWQFNQLVTRGNQSTAGYAYTAPGVKPAFYDVRLYANGKVFDDDDAAAYAALYPSASPLRPHAHVEANAANAVDTLYTAKQTTRLVADFQLLDKASEGSLFGAEGDLAHGLGVDANGNLAIGALQGAATRNRMLATLDFVNSTFAATNLADGAESLAGAIDEAASDGSVSTALFAKKLADGTFSGASAARIYSFEADENGVPVAFFAPGVNPDTGAAGFKNIVTGEWIGEAVESPARALRFYDGVGCADDYKYENGVLYAKLYASSETDGTVIVGDNLDAPTATGWIPHGGTLALKAKPAAGFVFGKWTGDTWAIAGGDVNSRQVEVVSDRAVQLHAEYVSAVPAYAKLDNEGKWRFFNDEMIPLNEDEGADTLANGVKVFFSSDAELRRLAADYGDEIAAANATFCLEADITLTADTDWRAFDFDMNGKTVTLAGYDLFVRKPQGVGRFTAGNLITNGDFEDGKNGWTQTAEGNCWNNNGSGNNNAGGLKDKPYAGNTWMTIWAQTIGGSRQYNKIHLTQTFNVPRTRMVYVRFRYGKYYNGSSDVAEYIRVGFGTSKDNVASKSISSGHSASALGTVYDSGIIARELEAGPQTINLANDNGAILVDEVTVSPESHLVFDIPEGEEYTNTDIVLGSTQDYFFDGMGLKVEKIGKGRLVLGKANTRFAGNGITSVIVEEGSVENAVSTGSGPSGAKVELLYGAQFDSKAATADGIYSLVIHTEGEDEGEDTLTYTNATTYANAVTYVGQGTVAVAQDATLTFQNAATAADCAVNVFGGLVFDGNGLTTVKSLAFASGATFSSSGTLPTTVVTDTFAPNMTAAAQPKVQLGDAEHLETTLDLSRWTDTFDDSAEGSLTFQAGSTVTIDIGERTRGLGKPAFLWKDAPDEVKFKASDAMKRRGVVIYRSDDGLYFRTGFTITIR